MREGKGGPNCSYADVCESLKVTATTVKSVRRIYVQRGLDAALKPKSPPCVLRHCLDGEAQAHLLTLLFSQPPDGHRRWSLRLLADMMVKLNYVGSVSHETVRATLRKVNSINS